MSSILRVASGRFAPLVTPCRWSMNPFHLLQFRSLASSVDVSKHTLNCSFALKKADEGRSFTELKDASVGVIQGIGPVGHEALDKLGIETIVDLANYKFYHIAKSISALADAEEIGGRPSDGSLMNINKAVDKTYRTKSLKELAEAPVAALYGLSDEKGDEMKHLGVMTVGDLGRLKYCQWAESMVHLSKYEEV